LAHPVVLVTGDADESVEASGLEQTIADSPKIIKWFA
jgi:hypothetical protein